MIVGKVVGSLISTRKSANLVGNKFTIVEPLEQMKMNSGNIVAIDNIGAGIGEIVLVCTGSSARIGSGSGDAPVDAAVVGIVDEENNLDFT